MSAESLLLRRQWSTTGDIAWACGLRTRRARKLLDRLYAHGVVEQRIGGDGARLWRFTPAVAYLLTRDRGER